MVRYAICRVWTKAMPIETDILVLGGGCAGLSLAMRLAAHGADCPRVAVVESRAHYANDRTWSFWDDGRTELCDLVRQRWPAVSVAHDGRRITVGCLASPYAVIPAATFYAHATEQLAANPRVTLALNEPVGEEPRRVDGLWWVKTPGGERAAKRLIDTRPGRTPKRGATGLWQSFLGHEIECAEDRFDPGTARLMEFPVNQGRRISFLYLLPFSPRRALVEVTVFDPAPFGPDDLAEELANLVDKEIGGAKHVVLRSEHGVLPMGQAIERPGREDGRIKVGLTAGGARPASGFAFQRIQRWATACAAALIAGRAPIPHAPDPWVMRAMDALFLRVLRVHPEEAPRLFLALFALRDPGRLVRFMSEGARWADYSAIIGALPPGLFLREIPGLLFQFAGRNEGGGQK